MQITKHKTCTAPGCDKVSHGKAFCSKHLKGKKQILSVPGEMQSFLRSDCCTAPCKVGTRHEYGEQYCKKCEEACRWKTVMSHTRLRAAA